MKSTYKLLGLLWDHQPVSTVWPDISGVIEVQDYSEEYNLFDLERYRREVKLSTVLSLEKTEEVDDIVCRLQECDEVYLNVDYMPECDSKIVNAFFGKRLMQIYGYIRKRLPACVKFIIETGEVKRLETLLHDAAEENSELDKKGVQSETTYERKPYHGKFI